VLRNKKSVVNLDAHRRTKRVLLEKRCLLLGDLARLFYGP
jgi:hypothetical protein